MRKDCLRDQVGVGGTGGGWGVSTFMLISF